MRFVLVGSGTGGHFYPLIAIAEAIRAHDAREDTETELYFMGPEPYNQEALDRHSIKFISCPAGKRRLYRSIRNYVDIFKMVWGTVVAFFKLLRIYPDAIMSKGGYTSIPVVLAAWILRIPIVIHESDAVPGRANAIAARFARYIGIAHDDVAEYFPNEKIALVGMPIRRSFFEKVPNPHAIIGVPNDRPVILVTGGSLGAQRINNLILNALDELLPHYTIIHQTGALHVEEVQRTAASLITDEQLRNRYFILGTMNAEQFSAAQDAAALIVSRAGSGTIFEIALKAKPAILIPIPEEVSRDQRKNAYAYARSGAATVIEEQNLTDDILASEILHILSTPSLYQNMQEAARNFTRADAADTLTNALITIGSEHE